MATCRNWREDYRRQSDPAVTFFREEGIESYEAPQRFGALWPLGFDGRRFRDRNDSDKECRRGERAAWAEQLFASRDQQNGIAPDPGAGLARRSRPMATEKPAAIRVPALPQARANSQCRVRVPPHVPG